MTTTLDRVNKIPGPGRAASVRSGTHQACDVPCPWHATSAQTEIQRRAQIHIHLVIKAGTTRPSS